MSSDTPSKSFPGSLIEAAGDKEGVAAAMRDRLAEDVSSLRDDVTKMHDLLSKFASEAGGQAARTARDVGQAVASHVGSTASGLATSSADLGVVNLSGRGMLVVSVAHQLRWGTPLLAYYAAHSSREGPEEGALSPLS